MSCGHLHGQHALHRVTRLDLALKLAVLDEYKFPASEADRWSQAVARTQLHEPSKVYAAAGASPHCALMQFWTFRSVRTFLYLLSPVPVSMLSLGRLRAIFIASKLTVMTRWNSSRG